MRILLHGSVRRSRGSDRAGARSYSYELRANPASISPLLALVVGVIAAMLVNDARMAAAEVASEAAYYGAVADGAFEPMASRILSPTCEAFPDRRAEMSTCLWSLASSCIGSAIIALGPNTTNRIVAGSLSYSGNFGKKASFKVRYRLRFPYG